MFVAAVSSGSPRGSRGGDQLLLEQHVTLPRVPVTTGVSATGGHGGGTSHGPGGDNG